MKKIVSCLFLIVFLVACERPATVTSWSPLSESPASSPDVLLTEQPSQEPRPAEELTPVSPAPSIDLANLPKVLPRSMKGYELVSWKSEDEWMFTLVTGTNRQKTFEELISAGNYYDAGGYVKLTVEGVNEIMDILQRLPAGESVFWGGINLTGQVPSGTIYFSYPSQDIVDKLNQVSKEIGFQLITSEEMEQN